jgi:hypothetical protein
VSILNKRNAVLGWAVWQVGKQAAKRKAKQSLEPEEPRRVRKGAVVSAVAAVGGAIWFWRRRRGGDESE